MTKIAMVKHNGNSKEYAFKTDINLNIGDIVVCDTANGYETGRVQNITDQDYWATKRWIVSRIDTESHVERVKKEKRISYLKQQIDMRRNEFTDEYINELISLQDKAMYSLLKELGELTNKNNTQNEIELKDSFYFNGHSGGTFIAQKHNNEYFIRAIGVPNLAYIYSIDSVKEKIKNSYWKLVD